MRALASFILRGPMQAVLVTAVAALVSMLSPPLTWVLAYVSGAAVALVTIQVGSRQGLVVTVGAVVATAVIAFLAIQAPMVGLAFALMLWVPLWVMGTVLRNTQSLSLALQTATALGVAAVIAVFVFVEDPSAAWLGVLQKMKPAFERAELFPEPQQLEQALQLASTVMTGSAAAYVVVGLAVSLILGRGWQAMLFHPGGLREEFARLRFDQVTAFVTLAVALVAWFTQAPAAINMSIVLAVAYVFHGLAVAHGAVARAQASGAWLVGLYVLMLLALPQLMGVLALVGFADTWLDFRSRIRPKAG